MKNTKLAGLAAASIMVVMMGGCAEMDGMGSVMGNGPATAPQPQPSATPPATQAKAQAQPQTPAQKAPSAQAQSNQPQQQAQANPAPTPNVVPQVAQRVGLNKCVPRIKQVTDFLTANMQHNGQMFFAPQQPGQRLASVTMELQSANRITYADMGFDPGNGQNECGAFYETVTYWEYNCETVATRAYGSMKRANPLRQAIMTLDGGPNLKMFLMPAGAGCVAIKKEMVYK